MEENRTDFISKRTNRRFLDLALLSFLGLGMEFLVIIVELFMYGIKLDQYTYSMGCMHLLYTSLLWSIIALGLTIYSKNKLNYDILKECNIPKKKDILFALIILLFMTIWQYIDWDGLKIIKEFQHNGLLRGTLQHLYYCLEVSLVTLIIIFGQKYGESVFKVDKIPYGGVLTAITWGAAHILTKDLACGIETIIWGIIFGVTYLILKKNTKLTYLFLLLMFIL